MPMNTEGDIVFDRSLESQMDEMMFSVLAEIGVLNQMSNDIADMKRESNAEVQIESLRGELQGLSATLAVLKRSIDPFIEQ